MIFPVSDNFKTANFQTLANQIGEDPGNVVNTDYKVIQEPTIPDYFFNWLASLFSCFGGSPENLNYDSDQIFTKIAKDIDNSLSQYILNMTKKGPGVSSSEIEKQLRLTQEATKIVTEAKDNLFSGEILIRHDRKKRTISVEKALKKSEKTLTKEESDQAVKNAFIAHQQKILSLGDSYLKKFAELKEGEYQIESYEKVETKGKWEVVVTFKAPGLYYDVLKNVALSIEEFDPDIVNFFKPLTKGEMLEALKAKENALNEQLTKPEINPEEKFKQEAQKLCDKVAPLIRAISSRNPVEASAKLQKQWNNLTNSLANKKSFKEMAVKVTAKLRQNNEPISPLLAKWNGEREFECALEKVKYFEPLEDKSGVKISPSQPAEIYDPFKKI